MKQATQFFFVGIFFVLLVIGCGRRETADEEAENEEVTEHTGVFISGEGGTDYENLVMPQGEEVYENLAILGKVWGFVKYTHYSFITGQLDWDLELLRLVSLVLDGGDVRTILYDWFVGLGEDGYGNNQPNGEKLRQMADLSWINHDYIGPLASHLLRFDGIAVENRSRAPVFFGETGAPDFSNQRTHVTMDFGSSGYRLLGLFRLWNSVNYFFPHLDVLDVEWNEMLLNFIPKMLEGADSLSYKLTLAALIHHLHDPGAFAFGSPFFVEDRFGRYIAPIVLITVENRLVVYNEVVGSGNLQRGDVLLAVNGRDIDDITSEMKQYFSYPNDDKALAYLSGRMTSAFGMGTAHALRSHEREIHIDVLRGMFGEPVRVSGMPRQVWFPIATQESHVLLDSNIGLINPSAQGDVGYIMEEFFDTCGIIIDMRQAAHGDFVSDILPFLIEEPLPFLYISLPSQTHPGSRFDVLIEHDLQQNPYAYIYDRPVVLLMDDKSFGIFEGGIEWSIMSLRAAPNVTVIGTNTWGAVLWGGNTLSLPGGFTMWFRCTGAYTPDGGQIHRTGLTPDIRVERTIEGIREYRDEAMEAAIAFILGNN